MSVRYVTNLNTKSLNSDFNKPYAFKTAFAPVIAPITVELWVLLAGALGAHQNTPLHPSNPYSKVKSHVFDPKRNEFEKNLIHYVETVSPQKATNKDILFLDKWLQSTDYDKNSASVIELAKIYFGEIVTARKLASFKSGSQTKLEKTTKTLFCLITDTLLATPSITLEQSTKASKLSENIHQSNDVTPPKKAKQKPHTDVNAGVPLPDPNKKPKKNSRKTDRENKIKKQREDAITELQKKLETAKQSGDTKYVEAVEKALDVLEKISIPSKRLKFEDQLTRVSDLMKELDAANLIIKIVEFSKKSSGR